ncbi:MAG TPA: hypothetical protein VOB72_02270 [Candidatus Dormibacteraeota bacterium]|nr:hypothetical protein [Candidatus Dormibacteraeota bacterium]
MSTALAAGPVKLNGPILHESTPNTIGSSDTALGYTFESSMTELPADQQFKFQLLGPNGKPQMDYLWDQTKYLHFLAIRNDFTNFAHVHPTLAADGTWSVHLPLDAPGPYQLYIDTLIKDAQGLPQHLVLRRSLTVAGSYQLSPAVPASSLSGTVDGYTITFNTNKIMTMDGTRLTQPKGWTVMYLPATVTYQGQPVTDLQPYLSVFAHFTAFNVANDLYGHAHPLEYAGSGREGWPLSTMPTFHGGPVLTFHAEFPGAGDYRTFVEFQVAGQLHTVSLTLHVS